MKPGSLILVHLIDDVAENYTFKRSRIGWPLHITVAPWFILPEHQKTEIIEKIADFMDELHSFKVLAGQEEFFGHDRNTRVTVIKTVDNFKKIHQQILDLIESVGGFLAISHPWVREKYMPHVTWHGEQGVMPNIEVYINNMSLVEIQNDELCKILKIWQLKEKA